MRGQLGKQMLKLGTSQEAFARRRFFQQTNNAHELNLAFSPRDVEHAAKQRERSVDCSVARLLFLPFAHELANLVHGNSGYWRDLLGGTVVEEPIQRQQSPDRLRAIGQRLQGFVPSMHVVIQNVSVRSVHLDEVWVSVEDGPKWT